MPSVTINPRQIFLNALQPTNLNGLFNGKNTSSFSGGATTSLSTLRLLVNPNATFAGVANATPVLWHGTYINSGAGAHYVISGSSIIWFDSTTGAVIASSDFAGNLALTIPGTDFTQWDWFKVVTPSTLNIPTSMVADYSVSATRYSSSTAPAEFRNDVKSTFPLISAAGYSDPYSIGNVYSIPNIVLSAKLNIKTTGSNNILNYELVLTIGPSSSTRNIIVDVSKNKIVQIIGSALVYQKSSTLRTDPTTYNRV
jgi:hypothetical protein